MLCFSFTRVKNIVEYRAFEQRLLVLCIFHFYISYCFQWKISVSDTGQFQITDPSQPLVQPIECKSTGVWSRDSYPSCAAYQPPTSRDQLVTLSFSTSYCASESEQKKMQAAVTTTLTDIKQISCLKNKQCEITHFTCAKEGDKAFKVNFGHCHDFACYITGLYFYPYSFFHIYNFRGISEKNFNSFQTIP